MSPPRLTVVLAFLLAVLVATTALELRHGVGDEPRAGAAAPAGSPPAPVTAPTFTLPGIERLAETTARPLFIPGRRMPEESDEPAAEMTAPLRAPEIRSLALSAIVIVEDRRVALLNDVATGDLSRAREGDSVSGWRVLEIRDDSVVIENDSSRQELPLRTFAPPPLPPVRNPPTVAAQPSAGEAGPDEADIRRPRRPRRGPRERRAEP